MNVLRQIGNYLLILGIPGLFTIALLDSAAIPLAGGPDAFIMLLAWQRPAHFFWIALTAATGSTLGCLILYRIGSAGGKLALARVSPERQEWVKRKIENNALWAVFMAVMVPPPFPTKPIILAAGVFRTPLASFIIGVAGGRLVRYTAEAYLGARLGNQAAQAIRSHYPIILLVMAGAILLILLARRLRFRNAENQRTRKNAEGH